MSEELIRRSDAIKAINSVGWLEDAEYEKRILAVPAIEPKRGWWMPYKQHKGETVLWKCTVCGHTIYSETKTDRLAYHKWCGKCGADMRGTDDE